MEQDKQYPAGAIPEVIETFQKLAELHARKNHDYTGMKPDNLFNFNFTQSIIKEFKLDRDKVFATLIGIKLARLAALLGNQITPNNESVLDSFDDAIVYLALWKARIQQMSTIGREEAEYPVYQKPASLEGLNKVRL